MKKYAAVFMDLDNTVFDFDRSEQVAVRAVLQKNGLPSDVETAAIYAKINQQYWQAFERGEIPREAIFVGRFRTLLETLGIGGDAETVSEDYFSALADGHDVIPGAVELLEWMHKNGIAVYATTNGVTRTQYKRLRDADLTRRFDGIFISEELGVQKPSIGYFDAIFKQIPFAREQVLLIGDSISSDIMGGLNAGIDTCWYNPKGKTASVKPTYEVSDFDKIRFILE